MLEILKKAVKRHLKDLKRGAGDWLLTSAIVIVTRLAQGEGTGAEKREEAKKLIREQAAAGGVILKDSFSNLLIEIAVSAIKNPTETEM